MSTSNVKVVVRDRSWLEKARRLKHATQKEVALAAGCSEVYYNRIENGLQLPNVDIAVKTADYLGVDVHNFVDEKILSAE